MSDTRSAPSADAAADDVAQGARYVPRATIGKMHRRCPADLLASPGTLRSLTRSGEAMDVAQPVPLPPPPAPAASRKRGRPKSGDKAPSCDKCMKDKKKCRGSTCSGWALQTTASAAACTAAASSDAASMAAAASTSGGDPAALEPQRLEVRPPGLKCRDRARDI